MDDTDSKLDGELDGEGKDEPYIIDFAVKITQINCRRSYGEMDDGQDEEGILLRFWRVAISRFSQPPGEF